MGKRKKVGVIGGGAAGFFAAISAKQHHPDSEVILFEKTTNILSKVKISGGGRCNVTHHCDDVIIKIKAAAQEGRTSKGVVALFCVLSVDAFGIQ